MNSKQLWLMKNGFSSDGLTYCVFGDDTYSIKEQLKLMGCKYHPILKWHASEPLDVPAGYGMFSISFDDILEWDERVENAFFKENVEDFIKRKFAEAEGPSLSEYVGEVGERLRNITAHYKACRGFMGKFGWVNIHIFESENNIFTWLTTCFVEAPIGATVDLTGTVKDHVEYKGVKNTQLTRCKVIEVIE